MNNNNHITMSDHEDQDVKCRYVNRQFKTHTRGKVKNKYRNMTCPCGSGKKFKKCCMGKVD